MAEIINGKVIAAEYMDALKVRAAAFEQKAGRKAKLIVLIVGDDPSAMSYIKKNEKSCEKVGIESITLQMDGNSTTEDVIAKIIELNDDKTVNGVIIQLPMPKQIDKEAVLEALSPKKDVDGMTEVNAGELYFGMDSAFVPDTPMGVMKLLEAKNISVSGKNAVVIGRSNIVGKPMAMLLLAQNATVTICHSRTKNIAEVCRQADILVSAVGRANFVTADMVKEGAVVMDVGTNFLDGKLVGDVCFDEVEKKAGYITPVPGGCGPMTVCMLIENTLRAAEKQNGFTYLK